MKKYSLAIFSCFLNHYQITLCKSLSKYFKDFVFVVSEKLPEDRKSLGFADMNDNEYVVKAYEDPVKAKEIMGNYDVVIIGFYPFKMEVLKRIRSNKLTFIYSERLFKTNNIVGTILRYIKYWSIYHNSKNTYLLATSAYATGDYNRVGVLKGMTYKWAYFSEDIKYKNVEELIKKKKKNSILWAGRLIDWKHPDDAINVAKKLKDENLDFELNVIGNGDMESQLKQLIAINHLDDCVHMLGSMPPEKVREYMEQSEIYLFTSDIGEGWGVVLNEAMNSCCNCIANTAAGSTYFLIKDGYNGYAYDNDNKEKMYSSIKKIFNRKDETIMKNAYLTIVNDWNADQAAIRLSNVINSIMSGEVYPSLYEDGVLSKSSPNNE